MSVLFQVLLTFGIEKMLLKCLIFLVAVGAGSCAYNDSLARHFLWPLNVDAYYHGVESCINVTLGTEYEVTYFGDNHWCT